MKTSSLFRVFPSEGYINTQFSIVPMQDDIDLGIVKDDIVVQHLHLLSKDDRVVLNGMNGDEAGTFILRCSCKDAVQELEVVVDDAFRYGDGALEKTFVFPGCDLVFICMKDRFHIYDLKSGTTAYTSNKFTINNVIKTGDNVFILQSGRDNTEHTLFRTDTFTMERSVLGEFVSYNEESSIYLIKTERGIILHDSQTLDERDALVGELYTKKEQGTYIIADFHTGDVAFINLDPFRICKNVIRDLKCCSYEGLCLYGTPSDLHVCFASDPTRTFRLEVPESTDSLSLENFFGPGNKMNLSGIVSDASDCRIPSNGLVVDHAVMLWKHCGWTIYPGGQQDCIYFQEDITSSFVMLLRRRMDGEEYEKRYRNCETRSYCMNIAGRSELTYPRLFGRRNGVLVNCVELGNSTYDAMIIDPVHGIVKVSESSVDFSATGPVSCRPLNESISELTFFSGGSKSTLMIDREYGYKLLWGGTILNYKANGYVVYDYLRVGAIRRFTDDVQYDERGFISSVRDGTHRIMYATREFDVPLEAVVLSTCNDRILCRLGERLVAFVSENNGSVRTHELDLDISRSYSSAAMSPDGRYLVYGQDGSFTYFDTESGKKIPFGNERFVKFTADGKVLSYDSSNEKRSMRVVDPLSMKIVDGAEYVYYSFTSPDGSLYAEPSLKVKFYNLVKDQYITYQEYCDLAASIGSYVDAPDKKEARQVFYDNNREMCVRLNLNPDTLCAEKFIERHYYVVIGRISDGKTIEVEVPSLLFLNFVSFSYDNRKVGIVGKPGDGGYIYVGTIDDAFSGVNKEVEYYREAGSGDKQIIEKATWCCGFSRQGCFGTSDSGPNLYIMPGAHSVMRKHPGRSWLCFSNSGRYVALSTQAYEAITIGGRGHIPSNEVFIARTSDLRECAHFCDHGSGIMKASHSDMGKNIVMASFSQDDSRFMTIDNDGVIIVRNLHLS